MLKKAVILFSGGLDSTTCLAIAKSQGFDCYCLSVDYQQRHSVELTVAQKVAALYGAKEHRIIDLHSLGELGNSALTDKNIEVPDYQGDGKIPVTYVPARNTVFLSIAVGWAEVLGAYDIFTGISSVDYSGYPDCRPEYLAQFEKLANLATKAGVEGHHLSIHAPLIKRSKAETIQLGLDLSVDYSQTLSCYRPDEQARACGSCDSCHHRAQGFQQLGIADPTRYIA